jgi:hypothetical protein
VQKGDFRQFPTLFAGSVSAYKWCQWRALLAWFSGLFHVGSNKKGASRISGRACLIYFYFQTSKLEGVNPPNFEIYISSRISELREKGWFRGLDKFSAAERFLPFFGIWVLSERPFVFFDGIKR